jgi:hypothetical protein
MAPTTFKLKEFILVLTRSNTGDSAVPWNRFGFLNFVFEFEEL